MSSSDEKPKVIVICGPTGIGKTSLSIEIAQNFRGEIISADSMQIYRYMDIGTAKPTHSEMTAIPHHLIDIINPDESFTAADFAKTARKIIIRLNNQGIIPFVVGGTGFYIKALLHGLFQARPVDIQIRKRLKEEAATVSADFLHKRLCRLDPDAAKKIHPNDIYRIKRALETYEMTGKTISKYHNEHGFNDQPFETLQICLFTDRNIIYDRINRRVDAMIDAGLLNEVQQLLETGYQENLKAMQSIGYRHIIDFIRGRLAWDQTVQTIKRDTRRYAKRQLTWFNADQEIIWVRPDKRVHVRDLIKRFLH